MNLKTKLHYYRFDTSDPDQAQAYQELLEGTLKKIGFAPWVTDESRTQGPITESFDFYRKIRESCTDGSVEVELETKHLFSNQWNSAPFGKFEKSGARLFNWARVQWPNRNIAEGYWLEQTQAMANILAETSKCGYCGHQAPTGSKVFCDSCLGGEHLEMGQIKLLRMMPISFDGSRPELTQEERNLLEPQYLEHQTKAKSARSIARMAKERAQVEKDYLEASEKARMEYEGKMWFMDRELNTGNLIYYNHTKTFCLGWREPLDPKLAEAWREKTEGFPFNLELKTK